MPMQVEEDLRLAQENFRSVRDDVWDNVITPQVEAHYPMADMKVLQRYSSSSGYNRFTDTDSCFYFKPQFADLSETLGSQLVRMGIPPNRRRLGRNFYRSFCNTISLVYCLSS